MFFTNQSVPPPEKLYGNVAEWNNLLIDLAAVGQVTRAPLVNQMKDYKNIVEEENKMKPRLFNYPNWAESSTVFDFEDLQEDQVLVLCIRAQVGVPGHEHDQHITYVWRGPDFEAEEEEVIPVDDFVQKAMDSYWGCRNPQDQFNIQIINEQFGAESDEFNDYF
jgi:hypothetical protein